MAPPTTTALHRLSLLLYSAYVLSNSSLPRRTSSQMPNISFRAEATGFSAPNPLLFEFGFKLGDDFQMQQAASLERAVSLQTQRGVNEYVVYVVAVDSVTGGRSKAETKVFELTEFTPDGDSCSEQETSFQNAVQSKANEEADFERLAATGDSKAIFDSVKAANGLGNADPPPCNLDNSNGGVRRSLLAEDDFFEKKSLEGLEALLETLQSCLTYEPLRALSHELEHVYHTWSLLDWHTDSCIPQRMSVVPNCHFTTAP
eukprot:scaffold67195_cov35-Tisochrysis_lutea.AAC.1